LRNIATNEVAIDELPMTVYLKRVRERREGMLPLKTLLIGGANNILSGLNSLLYSLRCSLFVEEKIDFSSFSPIFHCFFPMTQFLFDSHGKKKCHLFLTN